METPRECYELAKHCEEQAAMAGSKRARDIFLDWPCAGGSSATP